MNETLKTIENLKDTFKHVQINANEQLKTQAIFYESIRKLSMTLFDAELQSYYNKFIDLGKNLNDNIKIFVWFEFNINSNGS